MSRDRFENRRAPDGAELHPSHLLNDVCVVCLSEAIISAFTEAIELGQAVSIPLSASFDSWSQHGVIRSKGRTLENPLQSSIEQEFSIGSLYVSPQGKLTIAYECIVPNNLRIILESSLQSAQTLLKGTISQFTDLQVTTVCQQATTGQPSVDGAN